MLNILIAVIVFSVLVLFHEFGHFIMAKSVGIGVTEFSLGMGPRILSFQKGETRYSWKAIPFGGSCAMVGEDEENPAENAFNNKPAWARFLVVFAGPAFNIILAFIVSLFLVGFGGINTSQVSSVTKGSAAEKAGVTAFEDSVTSINGKKISMGRELMIYLYLHPLDGSEVSVTFSRGGAEKTVVIDPKVSGYRIGITYMATADAAALTSVTEGSPAKEAGFQAGDTVLAIDGKPIESGEAMSRYLDENPLSGESVVFTVRRGDQQLELTLTPQPYETYDLGFQAYYVYEDWDGNIWHLLGAGFREVRYWLSYTWMSLKMLVTGKVGVRDLSGPVGIVSTIGTVVEQGMESGGVGEAVLNVLTMMVLLSVNLGVMNLLPIPALDGGRLLFILIEIITRKRIPEKAEGTIHFIGFIILIALMVVILFSDVLRLFGK